MIAVLILPRMKWAPVCFENSIKILREFNRLSAGVIISPGEMEILASIRLSK